MLQDKKPEKTLPTSLRRKLHWLLSAGVLLAGGMALIPARLAAQAAPALPLRIVAAKDFCDGLQASLTTFAARSGYSQSQTAMLARLAAPQLLDEIRSGKAKDFINTTTLAAYAHLATKANAPAYLPAGLFIAPALGVNPTAVPSLSLAFAVSELRFLPFAQKGIEVIIITDDVSELTPARARSVATVAESLQIAIDVIWTGKTPSKAKAPALNEARALAWLAARTGGAFVDLSGQINPCGELL